MDPDFKLEQYERYYGDLQQVKKIIDECPFCGGKLAFNYVADYKNLIVQEAGSCPKCGSNKNRIIHIMN